MVPTETTNANRRNSMNTYFNAHVVAKYSIDSDQAKYAADHAIAEVEGWEARGAKFSAHWLEASQDAVSAIDAANEAYSNYQWDLWMAAGETDVVIHDLNSDFDPMGGRIEDHITF